MNKIRNAIKIYGVRYSFIRFFHYLVYKAIGVESFSFNLFQEKVVKKKMKKYLCNNQTKDTERTFEPIQQSKYIWTMWLQGYENAPLVVKYCIKSMKKYFSNQNLVIIDKENIFEYIDLPDFIIRKWKKGIISNAHFSDIVRLKLLYLYGGIWIDSTVFISNEVDSRILNSDFFFFQQPFLDYSPRLGSNWFLVSKKNSDLIGCLLSSLTEYWRKNNKLIDYYIFHIMLAVIVSEKEQFRKLVESIFYKSNLEPHLVQFNLSKNTSEISTILRDVSIHKLNWKLKESSMTLLLKNIDKDLKKGT